MCRDVMITAQELANVAERQGHVYVLMESTPTAHVPLRAEALAVARCI